MVRKRKKVIHLVLTWTFKALKLENGIKLFDLEIMSLGRTFSDFFLEGCSIFKISVQHYSKT